MDSKEKIYMNILRTVLRLELQKGHLNWSLSEISRLSDVTRSLIYYYFGKNKKEIYNEAISYFSKTMFRIDKIPDDFTAPERIKILLKTLKENPFLFIHFYNNKIKGTPIGTDLRNIEKKLMGKLSHEFPGLLENELLLIYVIELGILAYQDADDAFISWIHDFLKKAITAR